VGTKPTLYDLALQAYIFEYANRTNRLFHPDEVFVACLKKAIEKIENLKKPCPSSQTE
jgi:hypothetical protein